MNQDIDPPQKYEKSSMEHQKHLLPSAVAEDALATLDQKTIRLRLRRMGRMGCTSKASKWQFTRLVIFQLGQLT